MASTETRKQPPWEQPHPTEGTPPIKAYNSLTRSKVPFYPLEANGKLKWYSCGPTVYADSHLGHARNYVTIDILRRIIMHYFEFDLKFVMNVTDLDDKIILRARQQHLFLIYQREHESLDSSVLETGTAAFNAYLLKNLSALAKNLAAKDYRDESQRIYGGVMRGESLAGNGTAPGDKEAKIKMHLQAASTASEALLSAEKDLTSIPTAEFYAQMEDVLLPYLDNLHGSSIDASDYSIFTKLTQHFENRFTEDMHALNVLDPDVLTRVTEYVPQIVSFIERIVKNGFAYAVSDAPDASSVYFDIKSFEAAGRPYARLEPWNANNKDLQADGEGALIKKNTIKRSDGDFALWKSSKPGEPSWPSPWGGGRPGWHIECSAMASDVLGDRIDIHSGGIDLCFPHHDNELAQSEAYWAHSHQWINYFFHMGHLSIAGSKMSKSLKNFTTIREALSRDAWTARGLRVVFLLGGWKDGVEITDDLVKASSSWESKLNAYFLKAKDLQRTSNKSGSLENGTNQPDVSLEDALTVAKANLHKALCDSFDTPSAMATINTLITTANKASQTHPSHIPIAKWITHIVRIFGLDAAPPPADSIGWSGIDIPAAAKASVYPLSQLRDEVRRRAISGAVEPPALKSLLPTSPSPPAASTSPTDPTAPYTAVARQFSTDLTALASRSAPAKDYLDLCDQLRDTHLWQLGIYLEDRDAQAALVRPVDRELAAARAEREAREAAKRAAKAEREQAERERLEAGRTAPIDLFRTPEFTAWDADGLPTRDAEGKPVAKSQEKKMRKAMERQKKAHDAWLASQGGVAP